VWSFGAQNGFRVGFAGGELGRDWEIGYVGIVGVGRKNM
jgi:hypothetical protein